MPLSETELTEVKKVFAQFDKSGSGSIDAAEVLGAARALNVSSPGGSKLPHVEGRLSFGEFVAVIDDLKGGNVKSDLGQAVLELGTMLKIAGKGADTQHTIPEEEKRAFADHINTHLHDDKRLPINVHTMELFDKVKDGVLLCKLVNCAQPGTIDERVINDKAKGGMSRFEVSENIQLALMSARGVGCKVVNIGVEDIMEGRPHLVLGIISQLVRIQLLSKIDLRHVPELILLLEPGEELADLLKLPPEKILLRWLNFHLRRAGSDRTVSNFTTDIRDSEAYILLLNQLERACDLGGLRLTEPEARAAAMLRQAEKLGVSKYVAPADVASGNAKLNLAFVANIFNTRHGLTLEEPPKELAGQLEHLGELLDEDKGDTREERVFRYWINSLGPDMNCEDLFEDVKADGIMLLNVLERLTGGGAVDWRRVSKPPLKLPFKKIENLNYALELAQRPPLKAVIVGISGKDVLDGNKKLTLALIWQLMRFDFLRTIKGIGASGATPTDAEILKWANETVAAAGRSTRRCASFKDASLSDGLWFLELLSAVDPHAVVWDLVARRPSEAEKELNAKYIISVARKVGLGIFLLWEDIVEVNPKMCMQLAASIMAYSQSRAAEGGGGGGGGGDASGGGGAAAAAAAAGGGGLDGARQSSFRRLP